MNIKPPRRSANHVGRLFECQEAIDDALHDLLSSTLAAGWGPQEMADAIEKLTGRHLMALVEEAAVEAQMRQTARRSRGRR